MAPMPYRIKIASPKLSLMDLPPQIFKKITDHIVYIGRANNHFTYHRVYRKSHKVWSTEVHLLARPGTLDKYVFEKRVEAIVQYFKSEHTQNLSLYSTLGMFAMH